MTNVHGGNGQSGSRSRWRTTTARMRAASARNQCSAGQAGAQVLAVQLQSGPTRMCRGLYVCSEVHGVSGGNDGGVKGRERRDCCAERDHGARVEITSGEQHIMLHMRLLFFSFIQKSRVATPTQAIATLSCVSIRPRLSASHSFGGCFRDRPQ